jgi:hypothetical protein
MRINLFGMRTVTINNFAVHTFRVRVRNTEANSRLMHEFWNNKNGIQLFIRDCKGKSLIEVQYAGMDAEISNQMFKALGRTLKQVQLNNIEEKYSWAEPTKIY